MDQNFKDAAETVSLILGSVLTALQIQEQVGRAIVLLPIFYHVLTKMKILILLFTIGIVVEAVRNFPQMSLHEWVLWAHGLASGIVMLYWWISRS